MSVFLAVLVVIPFVSAQDDDEDPFDTATLGPIWSNADAHNATMWDVHWSPDGSMLAGSYFDNTTVIFDSKSGEVIAKLGSYEDVPSTRCYGGEFPNLPTRTCAWSPDGKLLATGGDDTMVYIFNVSTWSLEHILRGHYGSVLSLDFSPNGKYLASGSGTDKVEMHNIPENIIRIWDTTTWETIEELDDHKEGVIDLEFSPDGTLLASTSDDKSIRIWNITTWETDVLLKGHTIGVLDVTWSPDMTRLITSSRDYKVRLWSINGTEMDSWSDVNCIRSVDYHPNGVIFVAGGVDEVVIKVRDASNGNILVEFREPAVSRSDTMNVEWSPDGTRFAAAVGKEHTLRVYGFGTEGVSDSGSSSVWTVDTAIAIGILFLAGAVGLAIIYYPFFKRVKEGGK